MTLKSCNGSSKTTKSIYKSEIVCKQINKLQLVYTRLIDEDDRICKCSNEWVHLRNKCSTKIMYTVHCTLYIKFALVTKINLNCGRQMPSYRDLLLK